MGKLEVSPKRRLQYAKRSIQSFGATPWLPRMPGDTTCGETCLWSPLHASHQLRWPPGHCHSRCRAGGSQALGPAVARSALSAKPGGRPLSLAALSPFPSRTEGPRPALEILGGGPAVPLRGWLPPTPPRQIPASQVPLRHPGGF